MPPFSGPKKPGVRVAHRRVHPQSVNIDRTDASRYSVQLRLLPADRERNGCTEKCIEVESVAGVLAEIAHVDQNPSAQALLDAGIVLIATAKRDGPLFRRAFKQVTGEATGPVELEATRFSLVGVSMVWL